MLSDDQGRLHILSPAVKEQLHHMPTGYTAHSTSGKDEDRTHHRLIGNGWHWGVARRLLLALLVSTATTPAASQIIPRSPKSTTLQWVASLWGPGGPAMGPAARTGRGEPVVGVMVPWRLRHHWSRRGTDC